MNDEQLDQNLRTTFLYACLHAALDNDVVPTAMFLPPREVLECPSTTELVTRYPGLTGIQISEVEASYAWESLQVQALLREHNLDSWYQKVVAIERRDRTAAQQSNLST
jgi:hypothetical protein